MRATLRWHLLYDQSAIECLHRSVSWPTKQLRELLDLRLGDRERGLHDEPAHSFGAGRRGERSLIGIEGPILRQGIEDVELAGPVGFAVGFGGKGVPEAIKERIVSTELQHDTDDREAVGVGGVHQVHFHRGVDTGQRVLTRRMEVELLQLVPHFVVAEPVTALRIDLHRVAVVHDLKLLGVFVGKAHLRDPVGLEQACRRNVDR